MNQLSSPVSGALMDFDPFTTRTESDPSHQYGALVLTSRERDAYRYGKAGASAIAAGKLQLCPAPIANHVNQTIDAASLIAVGSKVLTLNNGGTAAVAGEYDQGTIHIVDGTGENQTLIVSHNKVAGTSADITVQLADPLLLAVVAGTTEYTLVHNAYNGMVEAAVQTREAAGVPLVAIAAGDFGFVKTKGSTSVLGGSAVSLGGILGSDASTAGAVTDATDQTGVDAIIKVGRASIVAGATGEYHPIVLSID